MSSHKGLFNYSGDESGNVALGQLGFSELIPSTGTGGTGNVGTSGDKSGDTLFVAIKVVGQGTVDYASDDFITITAESLQGDDLTACRLLAGDIIWGAFNYVAVTGQETSDALKLLCYHGS